MQDLLTKGIDENGDIRSEGTHEFKDSAVGRIPEEWEVLHLGDLSEISYGISSPLDRNIKNGIPIIALPNVSIDGNINFDDMPEVSKKLVTESDILIKGDLLFNWRNGSIEHLGKTAYFDLSGIYTHVGFLLKIRVDRELLADKFLYHLLTFMHKQGFFKTARIQVNNTFNKSELSELLIRLPKLTEQIRIVASLDALQKKIKQELLNMDKFSSIKTGLMQDLLTGKVRVTVCDY